MTAPDEEVEAGRSAATAGAADAWGL